MDLVKSLFTSQKTSEDEYEPLTDASRAPEENGEIEEANETEFSWLEYSIFMILGVAMLWAWNMFLAAAPYFQKRFESDPWIFKNFQSSIISVSTVTNLLSMTILANIQSSASYPLRIYTALGMNIGIFSLLTISTTHFLDVATPAYFAFVLLMVCTSAWATGLIQNGAFAFAASWGRPEYTQAIMAGQGFAGILPPLAQMLSVLGVPAPSGSPPPPPSTGNPLPPPPHHEPGTAAFVYFLTAVIVSAVAFVAFFPLVRRHNAIMEQRMADELSQSLSSLQEAERAARRFVGMPDLFRKLHWPAASVFMCFAVAMFFPVFTSKVLSVRPPGSGRLFSPGAFIPLGFFFWNFGDLLGRFSTLLPFSATSRHHPSLLFAVSLGRVLFLPLYMLCNIRGKGAVVDSDLFYLLLVQFPFGFTNGWLGSNSMMAAGDWVAEREREAAGSFMGLCLVAGLTAGSLLSFTTAGI